MSDFANYLDAQFIQAKIKEVSDPMYFQIKLSPVQDSWGLFPGKMDIPEADRSVVLRSDVDLLADSVTQQDISRFLIERGFVEDARRLVKRTMSVKKEKGVLMVLLCASPNTPYNGRVYHISRAKAPK